VSPTVVSDRFLPAAADEARREIVTPEGVPLVFTIARAGDRAGAFVLDVLLQLVVLGVVGLIFALVSSGGWVAAAALLAFFCVRNAYFIWFELRWQGRTPGKRRMGLRVIDAHGGALPAEAVVVRNLTREVEVFLPLIALSAPELLVDTGPQWVRALSVAWVLVFLAFPLCNRDRRRIGDLLGGTLVVRDPRHALLPELAAEPEAVTGGFHFTRAQLELYGIYELQVLEELLQDPDARSAALRTVAERIRRKIAWEPPGGRVSPREFLTAFYRAQRARLERDLVLGKARERKRKGRLRGDDSR
jgi:uncharacterized RDD family membrane protein YckC